MPDMIIIIFYQVGSMKILLADLIKIKSILQNLKHFLRFVTFAPGVFPAVLIRHPGLPGPQPCAGARWSSECGLGYWHF